MNNFFEKFHPSAIFIYFFVIISFTMFFMHPVYLVISMISAILYRVYLDKKISLYYFLAFILISLVNPLFSHEGATILFYLKNGNPITLESIVYGIYSGLMFVSVMIWFGNYNKIMSSDKFMYIFGKILPKLSMVFSMTLRFIPNFQDKLRKIYISQKCLNNNFQDSNLIQKAKHGMKILSILTTWVLESSIETADSMKSRGYGLKKRTSFSNYFVANRDKIAIFVFVLSMSAILLAKINGIVYSAVFPVVIYSKTDYISMICYVLYAILCSYPLIVEIFYKFKWRKVNEHYRNSKL